MISAAKPVGTHCSAQARPKLPPTSSRQPIVARRTASFSVIRMLRPMRARTASISDPAMAKRNGAHHRRRQAFLIGNADGQIGGAPEDVHQGKRKDHLQAMMAVGGHEESG